MKGREDYQARVSALVAKLQAERETRHAQIAREASGEAKGFRYAVECSEGWLGPEERPNRVHATSCTHREPIVYEGDRESAQARAKQHFEERKHSACHHSPCIVPEHLVANRVAVLRGK